MDNVQKLIERVKRLIDSGLCDSKNALKHTIKLKRLLEKEIDEDLINFQSRIFKALSDPARLKIVKLLSFKKMCVCELMVALSMTQPTVSHHLKILEDTGLVKSEKKGKWVFYKIAKPEVIALIDKIFSSIHLTKSSM